MIYKQKSSNTQTKQLYNTVVKFNEEINTMSEYKLKCGKIEKAAVNAYKKIEKAFVDAFLNEDGSMKTGGMAEKATGIYQKIEDATVGSYKKVEDAAVNAYKKVENAFVKAFLEEVEDNSSSNAVEEEKVSDELYENHEEA